MSRRKERLSPEEIQRRRDERAAASTALTILPVLAYQAVCPVCGRGWHSCVRPINYGYYTCPPPATCREKLTSISSFVHTASVDTSLQHKEEDHSGTAEA